MIPRKNFKLLLSLFVCFSHFSSGPALGFSAASESVKEIIESVPGPDGLWIGCEKIYAGQEAIDFYRKRSYEPVWIGMRGPSALGLELAETIGSAAKHGLVPDDYHYPCIEEWIRSLEERNRKGTEIYAKELAGLEIVMTDAFLNFGSHLADGKVDARKIYPQWLSDKKHKADVLAELEQLADGGSVASALEKLAPPYSDYWGLIREAQWLDSVEKAGGWPKVESGEKMAPGSRDPRIVDLARRLEFQGYLHHGFFRGHQQTYGGVLVEAVKKFQSAHGLEIDGVVGKNTFAELNVSAGERRRQILVNLERWRWLPRDMGRKHIRVNTAAFHLEAVENDRVELSMRVIVGADYQKTPVFSKRMRYIEINPYWNVPKSILRKELIHQFKKDPRTVNRENYEILAGWSDNSPVIDPSFIDWKGIDATTFPGRVRQKPGPGNALGRIKFMFPNEFNVYLHDTPRRQLFNKAHRALSHGCIRLENPVGLAEFVLRDNPKWGREKIENTIAGGKRTVVGVMGEYTVHLLYFTCWMEKSGEIQFRRDIYDRDDVLWSALNRSAAGSEKQPPYSVGSRDQ